MIRAPVGRGSVTPMVAAKMRVVDLAGCPGLVRARAGYLDWAGLSPACVDVWLDGELIMLVPHGRYGEYRCPVPASDLV